MRQHHSFRAAASALFASLGLLIFCGPGRGRRPGADRCCQERGARHLVYVADRRSVCAAGGSRLRKGLWHQGRFRPRRFRRDLAAAPEREQGGPCASRCLRRIRCACPRPAGNSRVLYSGFGQAPAAAIPRPGRPLGRDQSLCADARATIPTSSRRGRSRRPSRISSTRSGRARWPGIRSPRLPPPPASSASSSPIWARTRAPPISRPSPSRTSPD